MTPQTPAAAGLWLPLITPFRDGALDERSLIHLVRHYRSQPLTGLVLAATTALTSADSFPPPSTRCTPRRRWQRTRCRPSNWGGVRLLPENREPGREV